MIAYAKFFQRSRLFSDSERQQFLELIGSTQVRAFAFGLCGHLLFAKITLNFCSMGEGKCTCSIGFEYVSCM